MATHSSILAWKIPWTEEPKVHRVTKSQNTTEVFNTHTHTSSISSFVAHSPLPLQSTLQLSGTTWISPFLLMLVLLLA